MYEYRDQKNLFSLAFSCPVCTTHSALAGSPLVGSPPRSSPDSRLYSWWIPPRGIIFPRNNDRGLFRHHVLWTISLIRSTLIEHTDDTRHLPYAYCSTSSTSHRHSPHSPAGGLLRIACIWPHGESLARMSPTGGLRVLCIYFVRILWLSSAARFASSDRLDLLFGGLPMGRGVGKRAEDLVGQGRWPKRLAEWREIGKC